MRRARAFRGWPLRVGGGQRVEDSQVLVVGQLQPVVATAGEPLQDRHEIRAAANFCFQPPIAALPGDRPVQIEIEGERPLLPLGSLPGRTFSAAACNRASSAGLNFCAASSAAPASRNCRTW